METEEKLKEQIRKLEILRERERLRAELRKVKKDIWRFNHSGLIDSWSRAKRDGTEIGSVLKSIYIEEPNNPTPVLADLWLSNQNKKEVEKMETEQVVQDDNSVSDQPEYKEDNSLNVDMEHFPAILTI